MNHKNKHLDSAFKTIMKKFWWIIAICLVAPIVINYLLLTPAFCQVVGTNVDWLAFWGSYLAALISALIAFLILFIQRRDNHIENEQNRQLQINVLKYQQEMQWLNEKRQIVIKSSLALAKDDLRELAYLMDSNKDIQPEIKILLGRLVKSDSDIDFMTVTVESKEYHQFIEKRKEAFSRYKSAILDMQEINHIFVRTQHMCRRGELRKRLAQELISQRLQTICQSYLVEEAFFNESPSIIAGKIINHLPPLMEEIRKAALVYIRAEEDRISKLLKE